MLISRGSNIFFATRAAIKLTEDCNSKSNKQHKTRNKEYGIRNTEYGTGNTHVSQLSLTAQTRELLFARYLPGYPHHPFYEDPLVPFPWVLSSVARLILPHCSLGWLPLLRFLFHDNYTAQRCVAAGSFSCFSSLALPFIFFSSGTIYY